MLTLIVIVLLLWMAKEAWFVYTTIKRRNFLITTPRHSRSVGTWIDRIFNQTANFEAELKQLTEKLGSRGVLELASPVTLEILRESSSAILCGSLALMQIAHPYIAYGLKQHARSLHGTALRLRFIETVRYAHITLFGPTEDMLKLARYVYRTHKNVRGEYIAEEGYRESYEAMNPTNLLWVYATMIDYGIFSHELFVRPLTEAEKECHYQFMRKIAPIWGLSTSACPPTWFDFMNYYSFMVCRGTLSVPLPTREMIESAYKDRPWTLTHAIALTPTPLHERFGQPRMWYAYLMTTFIRSIYRLLPRRFRQLTAYTDWETRWRQRPPHWLSRLGATVGHHLLERLRKSSKA